MLDNPIDSNDYVEINPEYVYLTIPSKYVCIYHKLLVYMADFGKTIVDDCNAICNSGSKNIIACWNLFQSAIACYTVGKEKEADFFIDYIKKQLALIYKGTDKNVYNNTCPLSVTEDGKIKAVASCGDETHFFIDAESGTLWEQYNPKDNDDDYNIKDDDLTIDIGGDLDIGFGDLGG